MVAVERGVVVGVEAEALGPDRVVRRRQRRGHDRVAHDLADLGADELGGGGVGGLVLAQVVEGRQEAEAAARPARLVLAPALLGR